MAKTSPISLTSSVPLILKRHSKQITTLKEEKGKIFQFMDDLEEEKGELRKQIATLKEKKGRRFW